MSHVIEVELFDQHDGITSGVIVDDLCNPVGTVEIPVTVEWRRDAEKAIQEAGWRLTSKWRTERDAEVADVAQA